VPTADHPVLRQADSTKVRADRGNTATASLAAMLAADQGQQAAVKAARNKSPTRLPPAASSYALGDPTSAEPPYASRSRGRPPGPCTGWPLSMAAGEQRPFISSNQPAQDSGTSEATKFNGLLKAAEAVAAAEPSAAAADELITRGRGVAEAAMDMPPSQLCNPLVVMALMALSRQAAEQVMDDRARAQSGVAQEQKKDGPPLRARDRGTAVSGGSSQGGSMLHLPSTRRDGGDSPQHDDMDTAMLSHIQRLEADLQEERRRGQCLELTVHEVNESLRLLHAMLVTAGLERDTAMSQLAQVESLFEMERSAWEADSQHLEMYAGRLRSTLDNSEAQLEALELELVQERLVKERAMAFITQRALMASHQAQDHSPAARPVPELAPARVPRDVRPYTPGPGPSSASAPTSLQGFNDNWMNSYRQSIRHSASSAPGGTSASTRHAAQFPSPSLRRRDLA